jgi:hypothetical protein
MSRTIKPGRLTWRDECRPMTPARWKVPAYGFLDHFEIYLADPIPNMDSSALVELEVTLFVNGQVIHADKVIATAREAVIDVDAQSS